jgi:hypothetical protein
MLKSFNENNSQAKLTNDGNNAVIQHAKPFHFTQETINSLSDLGDVLLSIHRRLISEGYTIKNGIISKQDDQK